MEELINNVKDLATSAMGKMIVLAFGFGVCPAILLMMVTSSLQK